MNSGGPPGPASAGGGSGAVQLSTEAAISALEQHDQLFHRQVMHLRQQQVSTHSYIADTVTETIYMMASTHR